jgi:hypothetical protein
MKRDCSTMAFLVAAISLSSVPGGAQGARSRPPQRFEVSYLLGRVQPSVVVDEPGPLRSPVTLRELDDSYGALTQDLTAAIWWTARMSTIVGAGWSAESSRSHTFPRPAFQPIPFTHYEAERTVRYRSRFLSIAQAWDLGPAGPVVPFVAAGVEFRSVTNRQDIVSVGYFDPMSRLSSTNERSGTQTAALARAGLRILVGRRFVASADGALFATHSEEPLGDFTGRWRVGSGVRF